MPTQKLQRLRNRLQRLRRRRMLLRWIAGYSALALTVLCVLGAAFLIDWYFEMDRLQRGVLLAIGVGVLIWSFRRYTLPWLGRRESLLDMALLVEKHEGIDSDIVAALQFEQPEASQWGSEQLEQAVIDRVAELGHWLNVLRGFSPVLIGRRLALLGVAAVLFAVGLFLVPEYLSVFFNRLLLGARHYPTHTVIERLLVNGREVDVSQPRRTVVHAPYGKPVTFEAVCSGALPPGGRADLRALMSGLQTKVALSADKVAPGKFAGEVPRLVESVEYQVYLGDAWTDPARIVIAPLPVVDLELEVIPPEYVSAGARPQRMPKGLRQIAVIEGSQVRFHLASDKRLRQARISLAGRTQRFTRGQKLDPSQNRPEEWVYAGLPAVVEPVRYAVQVTDQDGLQMENPIQGVIRIKPDGRPLVAAAALTPYVLPTARPTIEMEARDDYGLAAVALVCRVERGVGGPPASGVGGPPASGVGGPPAAGASAAELPAQEFEIFRLPEGQKPQKLLARQHRFDLSALSLQKGDRLEVTVKATDYRGPRPGLAGLSEPLVFQVTDEQGILAMMMEADRKSLQQIKAMVRRQLGVGESP